MLYQKQHQVVVDAPLDEVWDFMREFQNWAQCMPGFRDLEIDSQTDSTWRFEVQVGPFNKEGHLKVRISEWNEPRNVSFILDGVEEPLKGSGAFWTQKLSDKQTELNFQLELHPGGLTGRFLQPFIPAYLDWFSKGFARKLKGAMENEG